MSDRRMGVGNSHREQVDSLVPRLTLAALTLVAAVPLILIGAFVPRPLVLPAISAAAIGVAAIAALGAFAWRARRDSQSITLWDIAGASALIGCAAAMLSQPEDVTALFGQRNIP